MQFQTKTISEKIYNERLDSFLAKELKLSRNYVQKLIKNGHIRVNNKEVSKFGITLNKGDRISYRIPEPITTSIKAENIPLDIIFEDKNILVINKAAGIVVHPDSSGHFSGTIVNAALSHSKDLSGIGGVLRPGIIHRLDKDTSGVLLIAKNDKTHQKYSKLFQDRKVEKIYYALVSGTPKTDTGKIDAPIKRSTSDRKRMSINFSGKNAISNFEIIKKFSGFSLLKINIETGRTHQIRVHMASIGHPIVGDKTYGNKKINKVFEKKHSLKRQFLHAYSIKIDSKTFTAKLPKQLESILLALP